jgi:hypothetical protein
MKRAVKRKDGIYHPGIGMMVFCEFIMLTPGPICHQMKKMKVSRMNTGISMAPE